MARARWPRPIWNISTRPKGRKSPAKHFYRPRLAEVAQKYAGQFPNLPLFTMDEVFGGWKTAQAEHFADGGVFDQIYMQPSQ